MIRGAYIGPFISHKRPCKFLFNRSLRLGFHFDIGLNLKKTYKAIGCRSPEVTIALNL